MITVQCLEGGREGGREVVCSVGAGRLGVTDTGVACVSFSATPQCTGGAEAKQHSSITVTQWASPHPRPLLLSVFLSWAIARSLSLSRCLTLTLPTTLSLPLFLSLYLPLTLSILFYPSLGPNFIDWQQAKQRATSKVHWAWSKATVWLTHPCLLLGPCLWYSICKMILPSH